MAQHQVQRIALKGADIDIAGKKRFDDAPRCRQRPDALTIELPPALPIVWQEVMPEGIIAGMGILDRVSDAPVKVSSIEKYSESARTRRCGAYTGRPGI